MPVAKSPAVFVLLLLLAGAAAAAYAPEPPGATDPPPATPAQQPARQPAPEAEAEARGVAAGLADDDWMRRQQAEDALVAMGEAARAAIHDLLARADDAEVRARLESALGRIAADRLTGPSYVTLRLKDATPGAAFTELSRQGFTDLKPYPDDLWDRGNWPAVTVELERQPFWAAAQALSAKAGVGLQAWEGGLRLVHGAGQLSGPSVVHGPFLVVATHVTRSQTIVLGSADGPPPPARPAIVRGRNNEFGVHLLIVPEPKLSVVRAASAVRLEVAVDDQGNDLAPPRKVGGHTYANGHAGVWNVYARLNYPDANPGTRIARLAGAATFAVQTRSERIEIADPLNVNDAFRVLAGSRVTFHRMARRGDNYELTASLSPDGVGGGGGGGGAGGASTLFQSMQTRLRLLNAAGEPLERRGFNSQGNGREMRFTIHFARGAGAAGPDAPARLVWDVPTETQDLHVPFEFTDLPLP
jgi:hypothetical protein